jgi:hypothetical protein
MTQRLIKNNQNDAYWQFFLLVVRLFSIYFSRIRLLLLLLTLIITVIVVKVIIFIITIGFHLIFMQAIRGPDHQKKGWLKYISSGKLWGLFIVRNRDTDKETLKNCD